MDEGHDEASHKWGVKVNGVELQDINPPVHIREAMEKQMQAERSKRASILEAEGDKQALILRAEGEAKSIIWKAQGEADAFQSITQAVASMNTDPVNYLLAIRYIDTLKEMVSGKDNKVIYMPFEASNILGSIGGIKELLNGGKS
jgi:regulator of protease activity HflC (stomatin/prohibitin superfamily)